jgi:hypothetical protein
MISHLDDEQVSAAVDGEASPDELAHLEGCETCRSRVEEFRGVARAVGASVTADTALREAAIAAAMAPVGAKVATSRRRPARLAWLAAAAALVLGVAVSVPLLRSKETSKSTSAARPLERTEQGTPSLGSAADATELGEQSNPSALAELVRQRLATGGGQAAAAQQAPAAQAPTNGAGGGGGGSQSFSAGKSEAPCLSEAARAAGFPPSALRYQATLTWMGRPARVTVFGPDPHPVGVVIAPPTCELLARLPL